MAKRTHVPPEIFRNIVKIVSRNGPRVKNVDAGRMFDRLAEVILLREVAMLLKPSRLVAVLSTALALTCVSPHGTRGEDVLVGHPALTFGDIPYYIAREKGFYREEGFQVKDVYIRGGVTASQALQAGSLHFTLALGSGVRAALSGMTIKAVMVYCDKPYHFLYGRPDLGVRGPKDLKDKKIGVTGLGSTTYFATRKVAERLGYDPDKDVSILAIGDIWAALHSGAVDAGLIRPPFTHMAEKMGMVRIAYVGDALQIPMSGLVTSEELIRDRPDFVRKFVNGTLRGLHFFLDRKNEAESVAMLNRVTKMEPESAKSTYEFYHGIMTRDGIPSERSLSDDWEISKLMLKRPEIQNLQRSQAEQKMYNFQILKDVVKSAR